MGKFLSDLHHYYPECFYAGETKHPAFERGDIVDEPQQDGSVTRLINMRFLSNTIRHGRKPDPDPQRSQADVLFIIDFVKRIFGKHADYELDTLAYMAQSNDRPGSMLFLVGDSGVGKSLWMNLQMTLFDGVGGGESGMLDGSKLMNENAWVI